MRSAFTFSKRPLLLIALAIVAAFVSNWESAAAVTSLGIRVPVRPGQTWYVCQGYNTNISHKGGDKYGLDLIPSKAAVGRDGCNYSTAADHQRVYTPVDGWISWKSDAYGLVCINLRSGSKGLGMSMKIGHMKTNAATSQYPAEWRSVPINGRVHQGNVLGYIAPANQVINGGVGHLHVSVYKGTGCVTPIPFSTNNGTELYGPLHWSSLFHAYWRDIYNLPWTSGRVNQWSNEALRGWTSSAVP